MTLQAIFWRHSSNIYHPLAFGFSDDDDDSDDDDAISRSSSIKSGTTGGKSGTTAGTAGGGGGRTVELVGLGVICFCPNSLRVMFQIQPIMLGLCPNSDYCPTVAQVDYRKCKKSATFTQKMTAKISRKRPKSRAHA